MKKFYDVNGSNYTIRTKEFMNTVSAGYKQMSEIAVKILENHHKLLNNTVITMAEQQRKAFEACINTATSFSLSEKDNIEIQKIIDKYTNMKNFDYFTMLEEVKKFFMSKDSYKS